MPTLSVFYGITIMMQYNDHAPPHFHARYGEFWGAFGIDPVRKLESDLPPQAEKLVRTWAKMHQGELLNSWEAAMNRQKLGRIDPLK